MQSDIFSLFQFSTIEWILFGTLCLCFMMEMFFFIFLYKKPYSYERKRATQIIPDRELPPLSVIITSKNDSENLEKNLPFILEQDYPIFEVVVVNNASTDDTDMILNKLQLQYPRLYHTFVPTEAENINGKKRALTIGIKAAKYEHLVFTEPHCQPSSSQWLKAYGEAYVQGHDIILGISKFNIDKRVRTRTFILYENLIHTLQYIAMAIRKKPFMANGENMGYRKQHFFENKGFSSILHIEGGEDNVFINKTAKKKKTGVILSSESIINSSIIDNYSTWRILSDNYRHTKQFYKGVRSIVFDWEIFFTCFFYITYFLSTIIGIASCQYVLIAIPTLFFFIRIFTKLYIVNQTAKWLGLQKYNLNILFLDILHAVKKPSFSFFKKN